MLLQWPLRTMLGIVAHRTCLRVLNAKKEITMKTEIETDKLELAKDAIDYTLGRIRDDENMRYHMGAFGGNP